MAAPALRRTAKSTPGGSTNQSWSPNSGSATKGELSDQGWTPNSGQASEGEPRSLAPMLASEHAQQPQPASNLMLMQDQTTQTGPQHQSVTSPVDQPQEAPVQYQPPGNDPIPLATETGSKYQPIRNGISGTTLAQCLSSVEGHTSRNIAAETMTPRCQPLPSCTTLPRHVDKLEADAASGLSAHSRLQTNANVLPVACAGQQFTHGEARLQQWSNRNSQRAHVHAQCVNGGVAHDHEVHPKQPTDQDAVEAVPRQRDCVTQAAADSEILLPITASSDRASTAAPADDEPSLFGREEAPRLDEEFLPMVQHGHVGQHQGSSRRHARTATTEIQVRTPASTTCHPPCHRAARSFLPSFRVSMEGSCAQPLAPLFFGRPFVIATESNCAHFLEARLDLFCPKTGRHSGPWFSLNATLLPVFSNSRKSAAEQKQSRVRKVATLAQSGERGRALAAARNAPPVPVTQQIVQEIQESLLYQSGPCCCCADPSFVSHHP